MGQPREAHRAVRFHRRYLDAAGVGGRSPDRPPGSGCGGRRRGALQYDCVAYVFGFGKQYIRNVKEGITRIPIAVKGAEEKKQTSRQVNREYSLGKGWSKRNVGNGLYASRLHYEYSIN